MIETGDKFYSALLLMMDVSMESQQRNQSPLLGYYDWLREFCTIKMAGPRRSGHNYIIDRLMVDHPCDNFRVITPYGDRYPLLPASQVVKKSSFPLGSHVANWNEFFIIVNGASKYSASDLEYMYLACVSGRRDYRHIILLQ